MEAWCAPRSDAERLTGWSAARRGVLVGVGFSGGIKVLGRSRARPPPLLGVGDRVVFGPADAVGEVEEPVVEVRVPSGTGPLSYGRGHLRTRDAGVVGFSSDPS